MTDSPEPKEAELREALKLCLAVISRESKSVGFHCCDEYSQSECKNHTKKCPIRVSLQALAAQTANTGAGPEADGIESEHFSLRKEGDRTPAPAPPARNEGQERWAIIITGEGATARIVNDANLRDELHAAWCVCGEKWDACKTEGITDDIRKLDDDEEWINDEDGQRFGVEWRGETGTIAIYKLAALSAHEPKPGRE